MSGSDFRQAQPLCHCHRGQSWHWRGFCAAFGGSGSVRLLIARGQEGLERIEAKVAAVKCQAAGIQADASSIDDAKRVIDFAVRRFGSVDILVNNTAVFPPRLSIEMPRRFGIKPSIRT